jgi:hypothetical protein
MAAALTKSGGGTLQARAGVLSITGSFTVGRLSYGFPFSDIWNKGVITPAATGAKVSYFRSFANCLHRRTPHVPADAHP